MKKSTFAIDEGKPLQTELFNFVLTKPRSKALNHFRHRHTQTHTEKIKPLNLGSHRVHRGRPGEIRYAPHWHEFHRAGRE